MKMTTPAQTPGQKEGGRLSGAELAERQLQKELAEAKRKSPSARRRGKGARAKKQDYDHYVKILLLGDSGVGKTCLLTRFADNKYSPNLMTTAGIDFKVQFFTIDGQKVKCQIWDTAGQERFHVITKAYYKGAHGIALVYDVTDSKTLKNIDYWVENIEKHATSDVAKLLIANKVDLRGSAADAAERGMITKEEGETVAGRCEIDYLETSAKTGTNVKKAFYNLAKKIISKNGGVKAPGAGVASPRLVKLNADGKNAQRKKKSCQIG